jgi:hypothetical protein
MSEALSKFMSPNAPTDQRRGAKLVRWFVGALGETYQAPEGAEVAQ